MRPPPPPFFRGATIIARDADGMLRFARPSGEVFEEPKGTHELFLPRSMLVHVHAFGQPGDTRASLRFFGGFDAVSRPPLVRLENLSGEDASALADALMARLGLPILPIVCAADELDDRLPASAYVVATGEYRANHGRPNFGRVRLSGNLFHEIAQKPLADRRYRVFGFYERPERGPDSPPIVGYSGPRLMVLGMDPAS